MPVTKHIVCFSGGHSSALVAIEVARKFGIENLILLNHNIHANSELPTIKLFKQAVADYIGVPITYANMPDWDKKDQFDVVTEIGSFVNPATRQALCTSQMKTEPFISYLLFEHIGRDAIVYYGFDGNEKARINRRRYILGMIGFETAFPLAEWVRTIYSTTEIGITPPTTYSVFKHANCVGCLKAKKQHWYVVYCLYPATYQKAKATEEIIGHAIIGKGESLTDLEAQFATMKCAGIEANENIPSGKFWADAKRVVSLNPDDTFTPCDCHAA